MFTFRCVISLLNFIRDRTFERAKKLAMSKPSMRQQNIYERHRNSLQLSTDLVENTEQPNVFKIRSSDKKVYYEVSVLDEVCHEKSCFLKCPECTVCLHTFMCTCPDSLVLNNMCKHIHLVRRKLDERDEVTPGNAIHGMEVDTMYIQAELDTIAANVDKSYEGEPHEIQNQIKHLCARIEELSSRTLNKEVLLQLKVQLNAALNTFLSLSKADSYSNIRATSNVPSNKNMDKQQRFYSIKKKRKRDICMKFAKPTRDEKERFEKEPEWLPTFISRSYPVHASAEEKHMTLQRNAEKSFTERGETQFFSFVC